jgi:hypothetical protein
VSKARVNADNVTADIAGITAGTGITGGGTSGTVTVTNSMATAIDAAGDLIYGTGSDAFTRLGLGTASQILRVNSGATAPEWGAAPESGGMTLLSTTTLSGASVTISGISGSYNSLFGIVSGVTNATANGQFRMAPNGNTGITYTRGDSRNSTNDVREASQFFFSMPSYAQLRTNDQNAWAFVIHNYASTSTMKPINGFGAYQDTPSENFQMMTRSGYIQTTSAITSLVFTNDSGNLSTGTVLLYGVK